MHLGRGRRDCVRRGLGINRLREFHRHEVRVFDKISVNDRMSVGELWSEEAWHKRVTVIEVRMLWVDVIVFEVRHLVVWHRRALMIVMFRD